MRPARIRDRHKNAERRPPSPRRGEGGGEGRARGVRSRVPQTLLQFICGTSPTDSTRSPLTPTLSPPGRGSKARCAMHPNAPDRTRTHHFARIARKSAPAGRSECTQTHPAAPKRTRFFAIRQNEPTALAMFHRSRAFARKTVENVPKCSGMFRNVPSKKIAGAQRTHRAAHPGSPHRWRARRGGGRRSMKQETPDRFRSGVRVD